MHTILNKVQLWCYGFPCIFYDVSFYACFLYFYQTGTDVSLLVRPVIPSGSTRVEVFWFFLAYFHFLVHFKFQFVKSIHAEENHLRYKTSPIETPIWNINMKQIWIINMNQYETSPKKFTLIFSFKIKVFLILKQRLQNDKKTMKQRYERFAGTSWCPH